jgi:DNA-binding NtrC family response regulator
MADILVVDDDAGIRQLLTDVLEMEGHRTGSPRSASSSASGRPASCWTS